MIAESKSCLILLDLREECVLEATRVVEMWSEMLLMAKHK
jgi:hypothetical protein